nr:hypothetical protein CQW23_11312 [Ipomoea batatas]GMC75926.1 hypothetical protein CQW23_11312 [Ipomoea batatas]
MEELRRRKCGEGIEKYGESCVYIGGNPPRNASEEANEMVVKFAVRLDSWKRRRNATETAGDTWNDEREPRCFFYLIPHSSSLSLIGERKDEVKAVGTPRMWWAMKGTSSSNSMVLLRRGGLRLIADKASNRSAVHGTRIPVPDVVDKEQVEMEVERGKDEKEKKRKEVENAVDDQLKNGKVISPESSSNTS